MRHLTLPCLLLVALGCQPGGNTTKTHAQKGDAPKTEQTASATEAQTKITPPKLTPRIAPKTTKALSPPKLKRPAAATKAAGGHGATAGAIKWAGPVKWTTWEAAQATGKPTVLLVYGDWCPRCRELAPVFADPEVAALAEKVNMVRVDSKSTAPWLAHYAQYGRYVPRLMVVGADGKVIEGLNSGHPRYPYFYTPRNVSKLKDVLRRAGAGG